MSTRSRGRVCFRPNFDDDKPAVVHKVNSSKTDADKYRGFAGNCRLWLPKRSEMSPVRILKHLSDKMATAMHLVSLRRRRRSPPDPPPSSSGRSKPLVAPIDSQRAEAIDDCIKFINSSSLQRTNSVSANPP